MYFLESFLKKKNQNIIAFSQKLYKINYCMNFILKKSFTLQLFILNKQPLNNNFLNQSIAMGTHDFFFSEDSWDRFTKIFILIFFRSHNSNPWKIREISKYLNWEHFRKPIIRETVSLLQSCLYELMQK
jgi:hypothetical protein